MSGDLQLLRRYHDHGDAFAFRDLVQAHAGMVFSTARRVTQDAALAEDVAQETFLDLARQAPMVTQSVSAWLHQVAWRRACNAVRTQVAQRHHEEEAGPILHTVQDATWDELAPHVDAALAELPDQLRSLLIEHFLEGCTQSEIAGRTGISQSTVSRLLDKALSELRLGLHRKGVLGGAALGALLTARSAEAAPQSLTISLGKLTLSSPAAGGTAIATFCAMNLTKIILATAATAALIGTPLILTKEKSSKAVPIALPARVPVAPSPITARSGEPKHFRPAAVSATDQQKVEAIIRRHRGMTKEQMQKSAELNELMNRYIAVINNAETSKKIEDAIEIIRATKPGPHGPVRMDFEFLDDPHGRAWLEAAVSNDPQRMQDWLINTLDGAVFELALDPSIERTSGGVSILPLPAAKPDAGITDDQE